MPFTTKVDLFRQRLDDGSGIEYRVATAVHDETGDDVRDVSAACLRAIGPPPTDEGDDLTFALNLMSVPTARLGPAEVREIVRRGTDGARATGLAILGGHTLDIDVVLYTLLQLRYRPSTAGVAEPWSTPFSAGAFAGPAGRPVMGFAQAHGCGAKLPPDQLAALLPVMVVPTGRAAQAVCLSDDAVVVRTAHGVLAASVDVITPVTNDPERYGAIAVAGSLSDLYAKGATPVGAIAIIGAPPRLDPATRLAILRGAAAKCAEAGLTLLGLHEVPARELFFGLWCTGIGSADRLLPKGGARAGDRLVLTKGLGTGVLSTMEKRTGLVDEEAVRHATWDSMVLLNDGAAQVIAALPAVSAVTDVTGFSLVGHLLEMLDGAAAPLTARLDVRAVPILCRDRMAGFLDSGLAFCSMARNRHFLEPRVRSTPPPDELRAACDLLYDAQTSGGLLIAVEAAHAPTLVERLVTSDNPRAAIIGEVIAADGSGPTIELNYGPAAS